MKKSFKFLAILLPLMVASNISFAKDSPLEKSLKRAGSSYRTVLLKQGWKPVNLCPGNKQPEIHQCSSEGLCVGDWVKDGKYIFVGTSGEVTRKVYAAEPITLAQVKEDATTDQCERLSYGEAM